MSFDGCLGVGRERVGREGGEGGSGEERDELGKRKEGRTGRFVQLHVQPEAAVTKKQEHARCGRVREEEENGPCRAGPSSRGSFEEECSCGS